jgi:Domain of unknown function (DUF4129)
MKSHHNGSGAEPAKGPAEGPTDYQSLMESMAADLAAKEDGPVVGRAPVAKKEDTSYESLTVDMRDEVKRIQHRSTTDYLVDFLAPFMIFIMVSSVVSFLLDWRLVFTEVFHTNLKITAFMFVLGIVALNRLVAREGAQESVIYILLLFGSVALYTLSLTTMYAPEMRAGAIAPGFLDKPQYATILNCTIVGFIWWLTNRLTHECCVDENPSAGEVGLLTGTARRLVKAMESKPERSPEMDMDLVPVDPTEWRKPKRKAPPKSPAATQRLAKRHPGVSIFYFSVPALLVFAFGLRWTQHGGETLILAGHFYVGCYTLAALFLLMLTSLSGLRNYFRYRYTKIPPGLGAFWLGLGTVMVVVVLVGAAALPLPGLPDIAAVAEHEQDPYTRGSILGLRPVVATPAKALYDSRFMHHMGTVVLIVLGMFLAYGALKALGAAAIAVARDRSKYPRFVVRFFNWLDRFLVKYARLPSLPKLKRRIRIDRDVSLAAKYRNTLSDPVRSKTMSTADQIEHAYDALCALAHDLGAPRAVDQTPYEFLDTFPEPLHHLRDEATELTELYVASAYSPVQYDERIHDRLRRFWVAYDQIRNKIVR